MAELSSIFHLITVKLIDFVLEMQHEQEQKVNNYEGYIDKLRTEIEFLQEKNENIEVKMIISRMMWKISDSSLE